MSFVVAAPGSLAAASETLSGIGAALRQANSAASGWTTEVAAAAEDEVSLAISAVFGGYARDFQALSARAMAFHDEFVQSLAGAGGSYAATEAASANPLQALEDDVLAVINAPTDTLFSRPLIGPGANGAPGTGQPGGPGGFLWGRGGDGGSGAPGQTGGAA
ncbi:PE family protein, partial [Mycobacterium paraense]